MTLPHIPFHFLLLDGSMRVCERSRVISRSLLRRNQGFLLLHVSLPHCLSLALATPCRSEGLGELILSLSLSPSPVLVANFHLLQGPRPTQ